MGRVKSKTFPKNAPRLSANSYSIMDERAPNLKLKFSIDP